VETPDIRKFTRQLALEIDASREESEDVFAGLPEDMVDRFLDGTASQADRSLIEAAAERNPELRRALAALNASSSASDVLSDPIPDVPKPILLNFGDTEEPTPGYKWGQVAAELKSFRDAQQAAWDGIDDVTLARFVAGEWTADERLCVERASEHNSELRQAAHDVRDALRRTSGEKSGMAAGVLARVGSSLRPMALWLPKYRSALLAASLLIALGFLIVRQFGNRTMPQPVRQVASAPPFIEVRPDTRGLTEITRFVISACAPPVQEATEPPSPPVGLRFQSGREAWTSSTLRATQQPTSSVRMPLSYVRRRYYREPAYQADSPDPIPSSVPAVPKPVDPPRSQRLPSEKAENSDHDETSETAHARPKPLTERTRLFALSTAPAEVAFNVYVYARVHLTAFKLASGGEGIPVKPQLVAYRDMLPRKSGSGAPCGAGWTQTLQLNDDEIEGVFVFGTFGIPGPKIDRLCAEIERALGERKVQTMSEAAKTAENVIRESGGDPLTIQISRTPEWPGPGTTEPEATEPPSPPVGWYGPPAEGGRLRQFGTEPEGPGPKVLPRLIPASPSTKVPELPTPMPACPSPGKAANTRSDDDPDLDPLRDQLMEEILNRLKTNRPTAPGIPHYSVVENVYLHVKNGTCLPGRRMTWLARVCKVGAAVDAN